MEQFPELFGNFIDDFPNFKEYLQYMRKQGSWGDHLTLTALSHLMLRPIIVLTDNAEKPELLIEPPEFISPTVRGPPLYLIHRAEIHYEGTCPIQSGPPNNSVRSVAAPPDGAAHAAKRLKAKSAASGDPRKDPVRVMESKFQEIAEERERKDAKNDPEELKLILTLQAHRKRRELIAAELGINT